MNNVLDALIELLNSMTDEEIVDAMSYKSQVNEDDIIGLDGEFYIESGEER